MRQSIVGLGIAVVIAVGVIGLTDPAAAQQYCATQVDGTPCGMQAGASLTRFELNSVCRAGECVIDWMDSCNGVVCQTGNECLLGRCVPSSCDTTTCTALNQCHEAGVCVPPGTCTNPVKLDGSLCDDGDAGTTGDRCVSGVCSGDPAVDLCDGVVCGAPASCRLQGTCDPATGTCTTPLAPVLTPCGGFCRGDGSCGGDNCAPFQLVTCSLGVACTFDSRCNPAQLCANPGRLAPTGTECDDGNPTTVDDVCAGPPSATCMGMTLNPAEPLDLTRAMIWARSRGKVRLEGSAPTIDTSTGLTMTIMDGLGFTVVGTVGPDDCRTRASSGRTKCLFRDPVEKRKKVRIALNPSKSAPDMVDFKIFMNKIDAAQPLDGPVMLTIEEGGGAIYEGSIATCQMQASKLSCR